MRNVMLDGALCAGRAAAMAELETKLGLPEWWGRNLDALHDCLWECGEVRFVVKNHQALLDTPFGRGLWQVLADGAAENPLRTAEEMMRFIRERKQEIYDKVRKGQTEVKIRIGAQEYTETEWDKLIESLDETEDDIRRQLQEAREQQRKDREKSKEI